VTADLVLAGVAPGVLARLLGETPTVRAEGAQVKVNLLLRRLPGLRQRGVRPEAAFGGTFHIHETLTELAAAHSAALDGAVPDPLPAEIYCHSLSDPSILGAALRDGGYQTLTLFGLHVPDRLVDQWGNDALRDALRTAALASLDSVLAEPIESVLATDGEGRPCIEVKTTRDIEQALAMPGGNIFHGPLSWPWAEDEPLDTPAQRWGVATAHDRVLLSGAGARRGGGVSGIAGQNAAMAALELLNR
jgi:phytoene dehydrogenase-like protein